MNGVLRLLGLPLVAVVLVVGVITTQVAEGGGSYEPLRPPDPCTERRVTSQADGLEGLTELLVLRGVADAACTLGTSREALTLELAQPGERTDAEVDALKQGLLDAVDQLDAEGSLPPASDLVDEALDSADLNGFLEAAIRALPDSAIDGALKTDDVLRRAIEDLDVRELLANLDDEEDLTAQVRSAITEAVKDALLDRLRNLI